MNRRRLFDSETIIHYPPEPAAAPWPPPVAAPPPAAARPTPGERADTVEAGVTVPTLQGAIVALFPAILTATLAAAATAALRGPWWIAPLIGLITWSTLASWRVWAYIEQRQLWRNEATQIAAPNSKQTGPPPPLQTIQVEIKENKGHTLQYPNLGIPDEQLLQFAKGLQTNGNLAEGRWSGGGALFSKPDFIRLRERLIEQRLAKWVNPNAHAQGAELTAKGKAVFRAIAHHSPTAE